MSRELSLKDKRANKHARTQARKATFTRHQSGTGAPVYIPVNKRARALASALTSAPSLTRRDLKTIASKGSVLVYVWTAAGLRKGVN